MVWGDSLNDAFLRDVCGITPLDIHYRAELFGIILGYAVSALVVDAGVVEIYKWFAVKYNLDPDLTRGSDKKVIPLGLSAEMDLPSPTMSARGLNLEMAFSPGNSDEDAKVRVQ
jgi:hypothetical protein